MKDSHRQLWKCQMPPVNLSFFFRLHRSFLPRPPGINKTKHSVQTSIWCVGTTFFRWVGNKCSPRACWHFDFSREERPEVEFAPESWWREEVILGDEKCKGYYQELKRATKLYLRAGSGALLDFFYWIRWGISGENASAMYVNHCWVDITFYLSRQ